LLFRFFHRKSEYFYQILRLASEFGLYLVRRYIGLLRIVSEDPISGFLLIVRTNKLLLLLVLLDTRSFQHIARFIDSKVFIFILFTVLRRSDIYFPNYLRYGLYLVRRYVGPRRMIGTINFSILESDHLSQSP